jgi:DNA-binding NtrC family response regulator
MVKRAVIMARGKFITPEDLGLQNISIDLNLEEARTKLEQKYIMEALTRSAGNITHAATELGITRQAFYDLLKKHGIEAQEYRTR